MKLALILGFDSVNVDELNSFSMLFWALDPEWTNQNVCVFFLINAIAVLSDFHKLSKVAEDGSTTPSPIG